MSTATVSPYGFPMVCQYDYQPEEPAVLFGNYPEPGSPEGAALESCAVGGVDIMDMLSSKQIERIEEAILADRGDEHEYRLCERADAERKERAEAL